MTDRFSLLKLPYVALREVLSYAEPEVILSLSFCSNKSKRLVKHCQGLRKAISITLNVFENVLKVNYESSGPAVTAISISVVTVSSLPADLKTVNIGSHVVPVQMERNSIECCDTSSSDDNDVRHWLEWIKARQGKLCRLTLSSTKANDNLLMYILESDIVTGNLILESVSSPAFRGPSPRPFSIDYLYLWQSKWVTLNHLLAMDIKQLALRSSSLTFQEINTFLKKWVNGECSKRIRSLYIGMENEVNYDVLMDGIEFNRREPSLRRDYAVSPNAFQIIYGGFDVRRKEDGAVATIKFEHRELRILFWPDNEGNPSH